MPTHEDSTPDHVPRVSVPMMTFRHARWVGAAIESVLAQDLDDWEIVVADDQSDDETLEVARSYEERCQGPHGPRLRILPVDRKYGQRGNNERALTACRGRYTSQLDGDDVFLDPTKLRRQADLLDADPTLVGVFGAWHETDQDLNPIGEPFRGFGLEGRERFGCADFGGHCVTTTCVCMVRTRPFGEFPDWWRDAEVGDWPLHMLNTEFGDYLFVDEIVAAHRNHSSGIWSARSERDQILSAMRMHERFIEHLSDAPPARRRTTVRNAAVRANFGRATSFIESGDRETALELLRFCARHRTSKLPRLRLWRRMRKASRLPASAAVDPAAASQ